MPELAVSEGPWRNHVAWVPLRIGKRWIWLTPFQSRRVGMMILGRGITFSATEFRLEPRWLAQQMRHRANQQ